MTDRIRTQAVPPDVARDEPLKPADTHLHEIEVCVPNNPNWPSLMGYLGSEYFKRGYFRRAHAAFAALFELDGTSVAVGQMLVRTLILLGRRDEAIEVLGQLLEVGTLEDGSRTWIRDKLKTLARGGATTANTAESARVTMTAKAPASVADEAHGMSGQLMQDLDMGQLVTRYGGSTEGQVATVEEQLARDPDNVMLLDWYAFLLYSTGRYADAAKRYERLIETSKASAPRLYYLGSSYLAQHRMQDALVCWQHLKKWFPDSPLLRRVDAKVAKLQQAVQAAPATEPAAADPLEFTDFTKYARSDGSGIAEVESLLGQDPDNVAVLDWAAFLNYSNGQFDRALVLYKNLIEKDPENLQAYYYVGNIFCRTGRYPEAARHWRILLERFPDHKLARRAKPRLQKIERVLDGSE